MVRIIATSSPVPNLRKMVEQATEDVPEWAGEAALPILANSNWPEDTGFSKGAFGFMVEGREAILTNEAPYAPLVEGRTHAAENALDEGRPLVKPIDAAIQGRLRTGVLRRLRGILGL